MDYRDLTPEERVYLEIFGRTAELSHFLSDEGVKALNDVMENEKREYGRGIKVLRLRFGLDPVTDEEIARRRARRCHHSAYDERCCLSPCRTYEQIAANFNVTRERIRQIEAKVIRRLRHPRYTKRLKPYLMKPQA